MARRKVQLIDNLKRVIWVDPDATYGATVGVNVFNEDGSLFKPASSAEPGNDIAVTVWQYILYVPPNVVALAEAVGTGLFAVTGPSTGAFRAITQGDGIDVSDGDGVGGNPVVAHADTSSVTDITANFTGGTVPDEISFTFDQFGHVLTRNITGRTLDHNDTGAKDGGTAGEYYHLTAAQHAAFVAGYLPLSGGTLTGQLISDTGSPNFVMQTSGVERGGMQGSADGRNLLWGTGGGVQIRPTARATSTDQVHFLSGGDIMYSATITRFLASTSDGADTSRIAIAGGGTPSSSRGAYIICFGNESAASPGQVNVVSGNGADIVFSGGTLRATIDNTYDFGSSSVRWANGYIRAIRPGTGTATWTSGSGTPEGVLVAAVGSLYTRTDGGAGTTLYVKESGAGNTGWVAK